MKKEWAAGASAPEQLGLGLDLLQFGGLPLVDGLPDGVSLAHCGLVPHHGLSCLGRKHDDSLRARDGEDVENVGNVRQNLLMHEGNHVQNETPLTSR